MSYDDSIFDGLDLAVSIALSLSAACAIVTETVAA